MARDGERVAVARKTVITTIIVAVLASVLASVLGVVTERLFANQIMGAVAGGAVGGLIALATLKKTPSKAEGEPSTEVQHGGGRR